MKEMRKPLILTALKKYADDNPVRFHMPGHKGSKEFATIFSEAQYDITELSFSGCLTSGEGVVAEAETAVAEILGAHRSHFVTDGSSISVLAMMYALSKRGKKVIIPRNSHKSVYNALKLFGLDPLFLECVQEDGVLHQRVESAEKYLNDGDVCGLLIVSPDYFGQIPDLCLARDLTKKYGKILDVDGAHGGHLRFVQPEDYAGAFADVWVDGLHKTMPCLTQASLLNVSDPSLEEDVAEGLSLFRTTSPSYPIMASIEYGVYFAESEGAERFAAAFKGAEEIKATLTEQGYEIVIPRDRAKLLVDCEKSHVNCAALNAFLEERGIFCEFFDGRYLVLMLSAHTEIEHLERLARAMTEYREKAGKTAYIAQKQCICRVLPKRIIGYAEAESAPCEWVSAWQAVGRIAAESFGIFPPCYPIVVSGEEITEEAVQIIEENENVYGIKNGKLKVVKEKNER